MMNSWQRPVAGQYDPYYQQYLDLVPAGITDILGHLKRQGLEMLNLMRALDEDRSCLRYEPGKWSIREVIGHLIDTERLFAFRSLWIARGAADPQPGMDENKWVENSAAHASTLAALRREQHVCRTDHLYMWRGFDASMRARVGVCNGAGFAAGAAPWLVAGHERHHLDVLRERYGLRDPA